MPKTRQLWERLQLPRTPGLTSYEERVIITWWCSVTGFVTHYVLISGLEEKEGGPR